RPASWSVPIPAAARQTARAARQPMTEREARGPAPVRRQQMSAYGVDYTPSVARRHGGTNPDTREGDMRRVATLTRYACWILLIVSVPATAYAQASVAGVVKDSSGAVLPGVTVEAASPALIEKVRSVVSDGTGQYQIVNLVPGTYSVTFSLAGFNAVKRE